MDASTHKHTHTKGDRMNTRHAIQKRWDGFRYRGHDINTLDGRPVVLNDNGFPIYRAKTVDECRRWIDGRFRRPSVADLMTFVDD